MPGKWKPMITPQKVQKVSLDMWSYLLKGNLNIFEFLIGNLLIWPPQGPQKREKLLSSPFD